MERAASPYLPFLYPEKYKREELLLIWLKRISLYPIPYTEYVPIRFSCGTFFGSSASALPSFDFPIRAENPPGRKGSVQVGITCQFASPVA